MNPLLILTLLASAEVEVGNAQHVQELLRFNESFNAFFRDLIGCPAHATDVKDCHPARGVWNQAAWKQLTEQAPRVFPQPKPKRKRWWQRKGPAS